MTQSLAYIHKKFKEDSEGLSIIIRGKLL